MPAMKLISQAVQVFAVFVDLTNHACEFVAGVRHVGTSFASKIVTPPLVVQVAPTHLRR
jgi:hypothetical protein